MLCGAGAGLFQWQFAIGRFIKHYIGSQILRKLDGGWPESETGDCSALSSYETIKIALSKSHDFFIQSVIE